MVDMTTFPASSMTTLDALLMMTRAVGFLRALKSTLSVDHLKRADLLAGLSFFGYF